MKITDDDFDELDIRSFDSKKEFSKFDKLYTPEEWKRKFTERLISNGGVTPEVAFDVYEELDFGGQYAPYDLSDDPEEAADEEMSYWDDSDGDE